MNSLRSYRPVAGGLGGGGLVAGWEGSVEPSIDSLKF